MKSVFPSVEASRRSRIVSPNAVTLLPASWVRLGMQLVMIRTKIDGRRKISFMKAKTLIVLNIVCKAGCSSPASRDPRFSLKAMSPMMSTVRQLIHVVKSTKPLFFCACSRRRVVNFEVWWCKTSCCRRRALSENPREYSRRSLRWSSSVALDCADCQFGQSASFDGSM
jgi:hypothetical protein